MHTLWYSRRSGSDLLSGSPPGRPQRVPRQDPGRDPSEARRSGLRILVLVGPTGTGKTETALLVARTLGAEIIGCDAVQLYRGLDTATAKATPAEREQVPHHLVDVADPRRDLSLADYVRAAEKAILEITERGRVPLIVGGTGLYLRGLMRGIVPAPPRDPVLRQRLRAMATRFGPARLHRWLGRLDPASAARLPGADTQRIVRALEIALGGRGTWSERLMREGTWKRGAERFDSLKIGLDMDRRLLDGKLRDRVNAFFAAGLVEEVRDLLAAGVQREANAFKAIGYREVLSALETAQDPRQVVEEVFRNTRRYAKRQRTWFRKEPDVIWLDASQGPRVLSERIVGLWGR